MRILLDTSLLVEGERRKFDLGKRVLSGRHEAFIFDVKALGVRDVNPLK